MRAGVTISKRLTRSLCPSKRAEASAITAPRSPPITAENFKTREAAKLGLGLVGAPSARGEAGDMVPLLASALQRENRMAEMLETIAQRMNDLADAANVFVRVPLRERCAVVGVMWRSRTRRPKSFNELRRVPYAGRSASHVIFRGISAGSLPEIRQIALLRSLRLTILRMRPVSSAM